MVKPAQTTAEAEPPRFPKLADETIAERTAGLTVEDIPKPVRLFLAYQAKQVRRAKQARAQQRQAEVRAANRAANERDRESRRQFQEERR